MRFVGERRALASVVFAFWFIMYFLNALMGPPPFARMFFGFAAVYGLAFFSLVAGYFWARWYGVGVGLFGVIIGAVGLWKVGLDEQVMILGGSHLAATLMLWGTSMSAGYDGQTAWRERFHMDDSAVHRLGRSVIRAGASLPVVLAWALAPKQDAGSFVVALGAAGLTVIGLRAMIKMRTWGVVALGAAGTLLVATAGAYAITGAEPLVLQPALGGALLVSAAAPWWRPIARALV